MVAVTANNIVVVSLSSDINRELCEQLTHLLQQANATNTVLSYAYEIPQPVFEKAGDPEAVIAQVTALVLVLEWEFLEHPAFDSWVHHGVQAVIRRQDFRVFVYFHGMPYSVMKEYHTKGDGKQNPSLATLFDLVQIKGIACPDELLKAVNFFWNSRHQLRERIKWESWQHNVVSMVGRAAACVQWTAVLCLLVVSFMYDFYSGAGKAWAVAFPAIWLALAAGVGVYRAALPLLYVLCNPKSNSAYTMPATAWLGVGAISGMTLFQVGVPWDWFLLGLLFGILLDIARRNGLHAECLRNVSAAFDAGTVDASVNIDMYRTLLGKSRAYEAGPMLSANQLSVFVSYTTGSAWSIEAINDIYSRINLHRVRCFFDREDLPEGACWRRVLHRGILDVTHFISLVDISTLAKPWPAAELATALHTRRTFGTPEVILLLNPRMQQMQEEAERRETIVTDNPEEAYPFTSLPIFTTAIQTPITSDSGRVVMSGTPSVRESIIGLLNNPTTATMAFLPLGLSCVLQPIIYTMVQRLVPVGALLAIPVGIAGLLQLHGSSDSGTFLTAHHVVLPACLLGAFLLGLLLRFNLGQYFIEGIDGKIGAGFSLCVNAVFLITLVLWGSHLSVQAIGWAIAVMLVGWAMCGRYYYLVENAYRTRQPLKHRVSE